MKVRIQIKFWKQFQGVFDDEDEVPQQQGIFDDEDEVPQRA